MSDMPSYVAKAQVVLDDSHRVSFTRSTGEETPNGGILWHRKSDSPDGWCCGAFFWRNPDRPDRPMWTLVSLEPLHLEPSFLCHCGHHGFIRNGKWQPA